MDNLSSKKLDSFNLLNINYGKEEIINQFGKKFLCTFNYSMDFIPLITSYLGKNPVYSYGKIYTGYDEETFINLIPNLNSSDNTMPEMDVISVKKKLITSDVFNLDDELDIITNENNNVIIYRYYDIKPNIFNPAKGFLQEEEIEIIQWDLEEYINFQVIIYHISSNNNTLTYKCSFKININIEENYNLIPEKKNICDKWIHNINKLVYKISTIQL
jgi:hypothetical protein